MLFEAVRHGDLAEDLALQHHERLTELKMRLLSDRVSRRTAWQIAREHGWKRHTTPSTSPSPSCRPMLSSHRHSCASGKGKGRRSASALEALAAEQD